MRVFQWKILMGNAWKSKGGELTWETYLNHCWWPPGWWRMPFLRSNKIFGQAFDQVLLLPVSIVPLFSCEIKENQSEWKINRKCKVKEVQEEEIMKKYNSLINQLPKTSKGKPPHQCASLRIASYLQVNRYKERYKNYARYILVQKKRSAGHQLIHSSSK